MSICLGLRAKEAVTVYFNDGTFYSRGANGRAGACSERTGPWGEKWGRFTRAVRAHNRYHPYRLAWYA